MTFPSSIPLINQSITGTQASWWCMRIYIWLQPASRESGKENYILFDQLIETKKYYLLLGAGFFFVLFCFCFCFVLFCFVLFAEYVSLGEWLFYLFLNICFDVYSIVTWRIITRAQTYWWQCKANVNIQLLELIGRKLLKCLLRLSYYHNTFGNMNKELFNTNLKFRNQNFHFHLKICIFIFI